MINTQPTRYLETMTVCDTATGLGADAYDKLVDSGQFALLSTNNKLEKSILAFGDDILTAGLSLAPHRRSGVDFCKMAGFCSAVCNLWFSGRTVFENVRDAMLRRSQLLIQKPHLFYELLEHDLRIIDRRAVADGKTAYVRLNVASDLDWSATARKFPRIRFYDYTKITNRMYSQLAGKWPTNYRLTYSFSERSPWRLCCELLEHGHNVSMVFDSEYRPQIGRIGPLPERFRGYPVIDGDKHDLRHPAYDGWGNIIGLRFKGSRKSKMFAESIRRGFTLQANNDRGWS